MTLSAYNPPHNTQAPTSTDMPIS